MHAGIGGNRKLWTDCEVTAVEKDPVIAEVYKALFPNDTVIVGDAQEYLIKHFQEFDFIWGSPPCPSHSRINTDGNQPPRYPEMSLYQIIIFLSNNWFKGKYCIENVIPYYEPLIPPSIKLDRHYYWTNFKVTHFNDFTECSSIEYQNNKERFGFDISATKIEDKRKSLRNLVDPAVGLHIFNAARGIITQTTSETLSLFDTPTKTTVK